jgi:translation initiation factor 2B subunit (eIF-2B alpha/beta/delta family)
MKKTRDERGILSDRISGSSEILFAAVDFILSGLKKAEVSPGDIAKLADFSRRAAEKYSVMAAVAGVMTEVKKMLDNSRLKSDCARAKMAAVLDYLKEIDRKAIENCGEIFGRRSSVATYSNSGLVKKALIQYRSKISAVYLSEGRPDEEGRLMASALIRGGLKTVFMTDMTLFRALEKADYFVVGADSVSSDYFVNKIGTKALMTQASICGAKNVVLFESHKLTRRSGNMNAIWKWREEEKYKAGRFRMMRREFEAIPVGLVDYFISDMGIGGVEALKKWIKKEPPYRRLFPNQ